MIKNKYKTILLLTCTIVLIITLSLLKVFETKKYDINKSFSSYQILGTTSEDDYINYLKQFVQPANLRPFIINEFVNLSWYTNEATGNDIMWELYYGGYNNLFVSLFDKSRTNFSDCPVSDNFKNKFNINLIDYFNLYAADDYNVNCNLDMENKNFAIEIYGIEGYSENLEPNYRNTYNFHYTLDDEGNVDDITFIEKIE